MPPEWVLPGGTDVDWLAAGTYDKSVGFSLFTLQITHKIETDIDEERDYVVDSLTSSEPGATVRVLQNFSTGYHSRNGGGDNIQTDGHLPVIDLRTVDVGTPPKPRLRLTAGTAVQHLPPSAPPWCFCVA